MKKAKISREYGGSQPKQQEEARLYLKKLFDTGQLGFVYHYLDHGTCAYDTGCRPMWLLCTGCKYGPTALLCTT